MGKKRKREARLVRGDELLEARGIDLDAPDEELFASLIGAVGADPDADLSIADWLGSVALEEAARRLLAWEEQRPADKDLRRVIRASLFRLQQRGIAAATRRRPAEEPVRLIAPVEPEGYLSALDREGNRLAWLCRPRPEGGLFALCSFINDRSGMRQVDELMVNKTQWRGILAGAAQDSMPLVAAPPRYVDWLMYEAHRRGTPRDERGGGYPLMRAGFYKAPAAPVACPIHEMIPETPADEQELLLGESDRLFEEPELSGWALPDDLLKVHQARFRDALDSTLVLSETQMNQRLAGIIDQAFEEVIGSEARALFTARMQEMALWYLLARRERPARLCYGVHLALADAGRRLQDVSFLRALVLRSFLHLMPAAETPEGDETASGSPPLILRPD